MRCMKASCLAGLLLLTGVACLSAREFTGKNGKKIEAEIVSKTGSEVELKLESGKTVTVPLSSLSEGDQLFVSVWESPEEKQAKLKKVEIDEVLAAQGYVAFPIEIRGQFSVVKLRLDETEATFMFNHSVEEPVLDERAVERLGLTVEPLEGGGGGNVVGTVKPEKLGNGSDQLDGRRFLVAPINGIPQEVDGLIGGQFFVDHAARVDFANKKLWIKE